MLITAACCQKRGHRFVGESQIDETATLQATPSDLLLSRRRSGHGRQRGPRLDCHLGRLALAFRVSKIRSAALSSRPASPGLERERRRTATPEYDDARRAGVAQTSACLPPVSAWSRDPRPCFKRRNAANLEALSSGAAGVMPPCYKYATLSEIRPPVPTTHGRRGGSSRRGSRSGSSLSLASPSRSSRALLRQRLGRQGDRQNKTPRIVVRNHQARLP